MPATGSLPLLLLDVDGVLNPFAAPACPPGFSEHDFFPGEEPVRVCPAHGPWLQELATRFRLVWATAWGDDANRLLAPLLQVPELPVIAFPPVPFDPRDKSTGPSNGRKTRRTDDRAPAPDCGRFEIKKYGERVARPDPVRHCCPDAFG
jgi:hypothetical protein